MKRFKNIISIAISEAMSDVYITGGHPLVARKEGKIGFHANYIWSHKEVDNLVSSLLNPRLLEDLRERKSVDHAISFGNARLRINFFTTTRGLSLAIRILPGVIPTIEELNLHPSLHDIATMPNGLVLSCGPTGVGKTSTIAAIINDINNSRALHIVTLENPIEYRFQSRKSFIQQRELGAHMPSFAQGLIDVLRENPDVIVVGELRDPLTMQLALTAAESGHLVIATMHASKPEEAIYRLSSSVPPEAQDEIRHQLSLTMNMIVVQQLVYLERVGFRVPVLSILRGTSSVKNIIRENKLAQLSSAIQMSKGEGMYTADRYLEEYLENRKNFVPYSQIFRPSAEDSTEILYKSPLTEDAPRMHHVEKAQTGAAPQPMAPRSRDSSEYADTMLNIEDDIPLNELIEKLK